MINFEQILPNEDGTLLILGHSNLSGTDQYDILINQYELDGTSVRKRLLRTKHTDFFRTARYDRNGYLWLLGSVHADVNAGEDIALHVLTRDDKFIFSKRINIGYADIVSDLYPTPLGGCMVLGTTYTNNHSSGSGFLFKIDERGNIGLTKTYVGKDGLDPVFRQILPLENGNYLVCGEYVKKSPANNDVVESNLLFAEIDDRGSLISASSIHLPKKELRFINCIPFQNGYLIGCNSTLTREKGRRQPLLLFVTDDFRTVNKIMYLNTNSSVYLNHLSVYDQKIYAAGFAEQAGSSKDILISISNPDKANHACDWQEAESSAKTQQVELTVRSTLLAQHKLPAELQDAVFKISTTDTQLKSLCEE